MPCMLGWFNMTAQTSLEDVEWLLARAAGFDAGFALNTSPQVIRDNGLNERILQVINAWGTARMSGVFSEPQKRRLEDVREEFLLEALAAYSWNLYPVYSSKHTLARPVQPGQMTEATWELKNPHEAQPLQFILHVSGEAPVSDLTIKIDSAGEILVAENELRIRELTRRAQGYAGGYDYKRLAECLKAAEKLQQHNSRLLKIIERTENKLSAVARKVAEQGKEASPG